MAKRLLPDDLWEQLEPYMPVPRRRPSKGGRPTIEDRNVLTGILFVLKTGITWEDLPEEMNCGCGMTCYRRLRIWCQTGVWKKICPILRQELDYSERINWKRAEKNGRPGRKGRDRAPAEESASEAESAAAIRVA